MVLDFKLKDTVYWKQSQKKVFLIYIISKKITNKTLVLDFELKDIVYWKHRQNIH